MKDVEKTIRKTYEISREELAKLLEIPQSEKILSIDSFMRDDIKIITEEVVE